MPALPSDLRKTLDGAVQAARRAAEGAARDALALLAVDKPEPYATMTLDQKRLRNSLRAKARQLGGGDGLQGFGPLVEEVAYAQWRRMLFARFLAENGLLMHPSGVAVTLAECAELAVEDGREGEDAWNVAARYAGAMLPGIFRADDPEVYVRFAPEDHRALERILADLPAAVFTADDALGWVYQFWQTTQKKTVNASGKRIGAAEPPPVTQLFTEHYMVRFLLENSLGAWWPPAIPTARSYATTPTCATARPPPRPHGRDPYVGVPCRRRDPHRISRRHIAARRLTRRPGPPESAGFRPAHRRRRLGPSRPLTRRRPSQRYRP